MNNADMFVMMVKMAIQKGMQDGGNTVIKEMAEMLPVEYLEYLEKTVKEVLDKKKGAIPHKR